jgi:uncharacterized protein (UPF0262 family)
MINRLTSVTLDEGSIKKRSKEAEHEKTVAIADLLDENLFHPLCMSGGPYALHLSITDGRLIFDIASEKGDKARAALSIAPLRGVIRDYFMICESYYEALGSAGAGKIEAIDMGRRGVHNEGSEELQSILKERINVDFPTARRLFTLICVLHIK